MKTFVILSCSCFCLVLSERIDAQESLSTEKLNAPSPDKKWDYVNGDSPELRYTNTSQTALTFPYNGGAYYSPPVWAPDSTRFAINYGQGRVHNSSIYELSGGEWKELTTLGEDDQILAMAEKNIKAQLKAKGLPENTYLRLIQQSVQARRWLDSSTAIVYVDLSERPEGEDLPLAANLVFTIKFDSSGSWKVIKTQRMSKKEVKSFETESVGK